MGQVKYITAIAPLMAYSLEQIDPAANRPEFADEPEDFRAHLRSAETI